MSSSRKLDLKLQSLLHALASADVPEIDPRREARELKIEALRDAFRRIHSTHPAQFRPGDLVRWQPGLKHALWPLYGEVAVVVECLDPPVLSGHPSSGSTHFRESNSLVLGLNRDGGFHCWHYDGRRFERVA